MTIEYNWEKLLNSTRRRKKEQEQEKEKESAEKHNSIWTQPRTEIERDFDRIVFATPTRRLANKTQVFPMDEHDSIRTRLTHSNEVSNLARGAGVTLCCNGFFEERDDRDKLIREIPSILATIGLVHDMGNPPYGHQGEEAIKDWFKDLIDSKSKLSRLNKLSDFKNFDGNAQTLRLVTRLHAADGRFGMDLTVATLSAMVKYPQFNNGENFGFSKAGVFHSEKEIFEEVWREVGLKEGIRHPLTYIMEVCDDIAYATIDAEDTIKKGYASFNDLKSWLNEKLGSKNELFSYIEKKIETSIKDFEQQGEGEITSEVKKEVSMEIFRSLAINKFLTEACDCFKKDFYSNEKRDWFYESKGDGYEIAKNFKLAKELKALKDFTKHYGFSNHNVLKLELEGRNYIYKLMNFLWEGIKDTDENLEGKNHFEKFIISKISRNYLREFKRTYKAATMKSCEEDQYYAKFQLVTDYISGMTESYLKRTYEEIAPFYKEHMNEEKLSNS